MTEQELAARGVADEYLTVTDVAARLHISPKTVRNRMYDGTWAEGMHWFRRTGLRPRFRWRALVAWLEARPRPRSQGAAYSDDIPQTRRGRRARIDTNDRQIE